jgi:hypothetical protein
MITLKGETIVPEFLKILDDYVDKTYGEPAAAI